MNIRLLESEDFQYNLYIFSFQGKKGDAVIRKYIEKSFYSEM